MEPTDRTEAEDVYDGSDADTSNPMSSDEKNPETVQLPVRPSIQPTGKRHTEAWA